MTSLASSGTDVIETSYRAPCRLVMAGIATGRRRHVVRRLEVHAREADQVAGIARSSRHASMGVGRDQRQPGHARTVTDVTGLCCRNMHRRLAGSDRAVVTTNTGLAADLGNCMCKAGR